MSSNEDGGPFASSKVEPTAMERVVGEMIWRHKGRAHPISREKLSAATGHGEREIKAIVAELVLTHRMKIGASRAEPVGYFMVVDAEDLEAAIGPFRDQIIAMWRRLRVLAEPRALRELQGQLTIEGDE
jgi:hypothetical protein